VAWLIYLGRRRSRSRLATLAYLQLGLVVGLMPLTLWFFGQASLIAPIANAILIPAAAFFVPMVLAAVLLTLAAPALGAPLLKLVAAALAAGWHGLVVAAHWPLASFHLALPDMAALGLALAGAALICAPRGLPARWLGLLLVAPALAGWRPAADAIPFGAYRLTVLDVGQGLASVVQTTHHTLVFDTGPAYRTGFNAGAAIVVPYLRHIGRSRVDALVLSHPDMDHVGGAPAVRKLLDVRRRLGAKSDHPCRAGQHWRWDGVGFRFLYPSRAEAMQATTTNQRSFVLRVSAPGGRTLLTGDIEAPGEAQLLARTGAAAVDVDVLVVAHHGSATSSSPAFIAAASPRYALIPTGWHNRWGFPTDAVVQRLRTAGAQVTDTAVAGALIADVGRTIRLRRWRAVHRRVWQPPLAAGGRAPRR
jgi:competence protein ComEC